MSLASARALTTKSIGTSSVGQARVRHHAEPGAQITHQGTVAVLISEAGWRTGAVVADVGRDAVYVCLTDVRLDTDPRVTRLCARTVGVGGARVSAGPSHTETVAVTVEFISAGISFEAHTRWTTRSIALTICIAAAGRLATVLRADAVTEAILLSRADLGLLASIDLH